MFESETKYLSTFYKINSNVESFLGFLYVTMVTLWGRRVAKMLSLAFSVGQ